MTYRAGTLGMAMALAWLAAAAPLGCGPSSDGPDSGPILIVSPDGGRSLDGAPRQDAKNDSSRRDAKGDAPRDTGHASDATASDTGTDVSSGFDGTFDTGFDAGFDASFDAGLCSAASCPGTTCCGTQCVDTTSDPVNCGQCFAECGDSTTCDTGACVVTACSATTENYGCLISAGVHGTCCGGSCQPFSTKSDPSNCGGCGHICPTGGTCGVGADGIACYVGDAGVSYCMTNADCPAGDICAGQFCLSPKCPSGSDGNACGLGTSPPEGICCAETCVSEYLDDNNCGGCGIVCGSGSFCAEGECMPVPSCATSPAGSLCPISAGVDGSCCEGSCIDLKTSAQSCGQCGEACPGGATCSAGQCLAPDGGTATCSATAGCPSGSLCLGDYRCVKEACGAADDGADCPFGPGQAGTCCGTHCINRNADPSIAAPAPAAPLAFLTSRGGDSSSD